MGNRDKENLPEIVRLPVFNAAAAASYILGAYDAERAGDHGLAQAMRESADAIVADGDLEGIKLRNLNLTQNLDYLAAYKSLLRNVLEQD